MLDAIELQLAHGRAARGVRGDGGRADPLGALLEHQGAPRRLDRAVRRGRPDGDAGRAHPRAPRRDAGGGRRRCSASATRRASRGSSTTRSPAAPTCPTSRSITPVFAATGELIGFAASRAHHADVGGRVPGSMPADSRTLEEEGVVISPQPLDERGARGDRRAHAPARGAPRRPARAARGQPHRRAAARRARRRASAPSGLREAHRRGARLLRAAHARVPGRAARRRARGRGRARGGRGRSASCACARCVRGRAAAARLRRQRSAARRATSTARSR